MARIINLATPDNGVTNGMELSFRAPCDCSDVTGVNLEGVTYTLVDASGESLSGCSKYFVKDAILTVIIDTVNHKANLLNPRVNTYTKTLGTPEDEASATGTTVWARVKQLEKAGTGLVADASVYEFNESTKEVITSYQKPLVNLKAYAISIRNANSDGTSLIGETMFLFIRSTSDITYSTPSAHGYYCTFTNQKIKVYDSSNNAYVPSDKYLFVREL